MTFALLFAAIPAGAVLGGIFSGWVTRVERQGRAVVIAIVVWGFAMLCFGIAVWFAQPDPSVSHTTSVMLVFALAALVVGGAADMASSSFRNTMLQTVASDDVRGRLQGVFIVVVAGGPRIADVLHGGVAAVAGPAVTAAGGGALVVICVLVAAFGIPVFVRHRVERST